MTKKLGVMFLFAALAIVSAKTYTVNLIQSVVAGTELKGGDYRLDVDHGKVVLRNGKLTVESPVKVEQTDSRFGATTVRYALDQGKHRIQEIRLGGTKMKLVFY